MNSKKFIPKLGQNYWEICVKSLYGVDVRECTRYPFHAESRFKSNCFKTEKQAKAMAEEFEKLLKNY